MNPSGYSITELVQEAQHRWLKPAEVLFILQTHKDDQITNEPSQKPPSGSLFLFNKRVLRFFRKDGHSWRRKKDGRTVGEAHERLKVGNVEAINCYYAHGEDNPNFQRRSYWMLDPAHEHIVLVHYRDIDEGKKKAGVMLQSSLLPVTYSPDQGPYSNQPLGSSMVIGESYEPYISSSSPGSGEITSDAPVDPSTIIEEVNGSPSLEMNQALRKLKEQLSLDDERFEEIDDLGFGDENPDDFGPLVSHQNTLAPMQPTLNGHQSSQNAGDNIHNHQLLNHEANIWGDVLDAYGVSQNAGIQSKYQQKFSIQEISPEWGYASENTKVIIVGSFLHDPSETGWTCMLGDIEVPVQIVRDGVMKCVAPPHLPGKVTLCITSSNRELCSEVREFEYRAMPETDSKCPEELLLLVRFVQTLLSSFEMGKGDNGDPRFSFLSKERAGDESWEQVIEALLFGSWTWVTTINWLLEELLKDKLQQWIYSRSRELDPEIGCSLSKKEQGIIHMIAGLGFEWALRPILNSGVGVNFRDINGWTALHWAARFGREKMVAELMASGASPGAVTDPDSEDPNGKAPASIAATFGHLGLAGYLSEVALTSHLSSLTLGESELSRGSGYVEAERNVSSVSYTSPCTSEDEVSLKHGLAAVRNATQAAARIQSAFRAHSFRKRQLRKALSFGADGDEYDALSNDIEGLSAASKLVFRNSRDYNSAAVSIQKKYRGWKGRKDFLTFRQKVVKIQAHVRGYQVRKEYKVCWATGILEKVVLRWRRHGVGLRGFKAESESIDETKDEDEDKEDILKVFRKQKVDAAIDEAVSRVLLMVECPDARQQYRRILEKYRQAKAEREGEAEKEKAETSNDDSSYMENDGSFLLT